jgi:hypothetical protein
MEGKIYDAISSVMAEIGAISKEKKNQQQGFMYRGIDDVYNALQPALVKHKVFVTPFVENEIREERVNKNGTLMFYTRLEVLYKFYTVDGSFVETKVIGEAMDSGDKATNKALSIAYKYACFQVFCIPTEEMVDPDGESHEVKPKDPAGRKTQNKPSTQAQNTTPPKTEAEMVAEQERVAAQKIDAVKITVIKKELARTGVTEKALLERYKVNSFEEMTEKIFKQAMSALEKTKSKGDAK